MKEWQSYERLKEVKDGALQTLIEEEQVAGLEERRKAL